MCNRRWLFSLGRRHGGKPELWFRSKGGGFLWPKNAFFATLKMKPLITFFFTMQRRGFYGNGLFSSLECLGFSPLQLRRYSLGSIGPL